MKIRRPGFTNLTRDHLDYHATMEDYRDAKLRLFGEILQDDGIAVINADVPEAKDMIELCAKRKLPLLDL